MPGYDDLRGGLTLAAPTKQADLTRRHDDGRQVPDDYLAFLASHDGAHGAIAILNRAAEVGLGAERNPELDLLSTLVIFGSDGGDEAFTFDPSRKVIVIPWIRDVNDATPKRRSPSSSHASSRTGQAL